MKFEAFSLFESSPFYNRALAPGKYNIKIVIQDVVDDNLDSAAFIPVNALTMLPLQQGDYNGDGCVNYDDYDWWVANYGKTPATFFDGDGNGDCIVNTADYILWANNFGNSGNGFFTADFNDDGCVSAADYVIWRNNEPIEKCATRFEGDANGDGAVNDDDYDIWVQQFGSCDGCQESAMGGGEGLSLVEMRRMLPKSPDADGDGDFDEDDVMEMTMLLAPERLLADSETDEEGPTLAPPLEELEGLADELEDSDELERWIWDDAMDDQILDLIESQ